MTTITEQLEQDRQLVEKLWARDSAAWKYVYETCVIPVTKTKKAQEMLRDFLLAPEDVWGMVYEEMILRNKLSLYKNTGSFLYWFRLWTWGIIKNYCRKNQKTVSKKGGFPPIIDTRPNSPWDSLEFAQKCFSQLWRKNPMRAYVHLLWAKNGLSTQEIMQVLGVSSTDNVYKMHSRAVQDMRAIRDAYRKGSIR